MLVRFSYPVRGNLLLTEQWPLEVGAYRLEWKLDEGRVTGLTATKRIADEDTLPSVTPGTAEGEALTIHAGHHPSYADLERHLRLIQGITNLFAPIEIDFSSHTTEWIAETEEERESTALHSISAEDDHRHLQAPIHLDYEYLARAAASIDAAIGLEIPLSFLRRGHNYVIEQRYIEAYYNLFFYFETQFAGGYSNPKKVTQRLLEAAPIRQALAQLRADTLKGGARTIAAIKSRLETPDEAIIRHLVDLRGDLHHHALGRVLWHPEKGAEFRDDVLFLDALASRAAVAQLGPLVFSAERQAEVVEAARAHGAVVTLRADVAVSDAAGTRTAQIVMHVPALQFRREMIQRACQHLHQVLPRQFPGATITGYELVLEPQNDVLARYERLPEN